MQNHKEHIWKICELHWYTNEMKKELDNICASKQKHLHDKYDWWMKDEIK
jgi:hypothetical protein